jgi:NAD+ synthase (glutamine-hydrolysing)
MKIAVAQLNPIVGDFAGNAQKIIEAARLAEAQGAEILLTPELSLVGYPAEDLLLRDTFYERTESALQQILEATSSLAIHLIVGLPIRRGSLRYNAARLLFKGRVLTEYCKHELPNYDVFDEVRYFEPDNRPLVFELNGINFGVVICEDFWFRYAPEASRAVGAEVLLVLNASPYHMNKQHTRLDVARDNVCALGLPMIAANLVGGQDELVFDGMSFALSAEGELKAQGKPFQEDLLIIDVERQAQAKVPAPPSASGGAQTFKTADAPVLMSQGRIEPVLELEEQVYRCLVLGVKDYVNKNGFPGVVIGLSGGIDSALTLAVAYDALGKDRVRAVMMPSPYTADISWIDARDMAKRLDVRYDELSISPVFEQFKQTLSQEFAGLKEDTTEENIQARIRGTLLMALSNKHGSIVLTTGNKSEMAVGYCTLYGDMAGGFAVIKDIAKTLVFRLCRWRNREAEIIPERIITRPPSAELRDNQKDQDSLPEYEVLDAIMQMYMEENRGIEDIIAVGHPRAAVEKVVRLMRIAEYKRRQAPIGVRVTHRAFGRDWRYPITSKFRD